MKQLLHYIIFNFFSLIIFVINRTPIRINHTDTYDWQKCLQFSLYGSLYVAPTLYGWVRLTSHILPATNVRTALMKTLVEQVSYGPMATASFFFIISLLDHKSVEESKQEVVDKFWPTYKVNASILSIYSERRVCVSERFFDEEKLPGFFSSSAQKPVIYLSIDRNCVAFIFFPFKTFHTNILTFE